MSYAALLRSYRSFSNSITDFTEPAIEQLLAADESRAHRERSVSANDAAGEGDISDRLALSKPPTSPSLNVFQQSTPPAAEAALVPPHQQSAEERSVSPAISVALAVDSDYSPSADTPLQNTFVSCALECTVPLVIECDLIIHLLLCFFR